MPFFWKTIGAKRGWGVGFLMKGTSLSPRRPEFVSPPKDQASQAISWSSPSRFLSFPEPNHVFIYAEPNTSDVLCWSKPKLRRFEEVLKGTFCIQVGCQGPWQKICMWGAGIELHLRAGTSLLQWLLQSGGLIWDFLQTPPLFCLVSSWRRHRCCLSSSVCIDLDPRSPFIPLPFFRWKPGQGDLLRLSLWSRCCRASGDRCLHHVTKLYTASSLPAVIRLWSIGVLTRIGSLEVSRCPRLQRHRRPIWRTAHQARQQY